MSAIPMVRFPPSSMVFCSERSEQKTIDEGGKRTIGIADIAIEHFAFGKAQRRVHFATRVLERQNPSLESRRVQHKEDGVGQECPDETRPAGRRPQNRVHRSGSGYRSA